MERVGPSLAGFPFPEIWGWNWSYTLEPMPVFADLHHRLIIYWARDPQLGAERPEQAGPRDPALAASWPSSRATRMSSSFDALARNRRDCRREPRRTARLPRSAGVDSIVDLHTGQGTLAPRTAMAASSACWENYVRTRHGGNTMLKALVGKDPERARSFQFSILRTVPKTQAAREVIEIESCYKWKLGTRAFGLNVN